MKVDRVRVGDVLALQRRVVNVEPDTIYAEIGVRSFGRGISHKEPVSGFDLGAKRVFRIEPGDLVISNVFAWEGAVALASAAESGKIGSHRFMTFTPTDGRIDPAWAAWFLISEPGLELIRIASPGSAGRNRTLAVDRFEALQIPLPPIDEQRRVAARLDKVSKLRDSVANRTTHARELLDAFTVSSATRPDMTAPDKQRSGWHQVRLGEIAIPSDDVVEVDGTATYDIAGVYSFGRGVFGRPTLDGTSTKYRVLHRIRAGQLIMSRLKAWEGALAIVPPELDGRYVSPEFPTFDLHVEQVDSEYLGCVVTSEQFWSQLRPKGIGARRERVSAERLLDQVVELPPMEEQQRLSRAFAKTAAARRQGERAETRIRALVASALHEAFADLS